MCLALPFFFLRENLFEFSWKCLSENKRYFTIGRVQRVAYQVLRALEYVHSLFLLHSDLKPENILIKNEATCEVCVERPFQPFVTCVTLYKSGKSD